MRLLAFGFFLRRWPFVLVVDCILAIWLLSTPGRDAQASSSTDRPAVESSTMPLIPLSPASTPDPGTANASSGQSKIRASSRLQGGSVEPPLPRQPGLDRTPGATQASTPPPPPLVPEGAAASSAGADRPQRTARQAPGIPTDSPGGQAVVSTASSADGLESSSAGERLATRESSPALPGASVSPPLDVNGRAGALSALPSATAPVVTQRDVQGSKDESTPSVRQGLSRGTEKKEGSATAGSSFEEEHVTGVALQDQETKHSLAFTTGSAKAQESTKPEDQETRDSGGLNPEEGSAPLASQQTLSKHVGTETTVGDARTSSPPGLQGLASPSSFQEVDRGFGANSGGLLPAEETSRFPGSGTFADRTAMPPSAHIDGHLPFHPRVAGVAAVPFPFPRLFAATSPASDLQASGADNSGAASREGTGPSVASSLPPSSFALPYRSEKDTGIAVSDLRQPLAGPLFRSGPTKKPAPLRLLPLSGPGSQVPVERSGLDDGEVLDQSRAATASGHDAGTPAPGSLSLPSSLTPSFFDSLPVSSRLPPSSFNGTAAPVLASEPVPRPLPNLPGLSSQPSPGSRDQNRTGDEATSSKTQQATVPKKPAILPSTSFFNVFFLLIGLFVFAVLAASGGIGGGSVFVALLVGVGRVHLSYAVPISKAMVFCSAFSSFVLNRKLERQTVEQVRAVSQGWVDLLVPLALSGSVVGVLLNTVVPPFLLLVILSLLLLSLSVRTIVSAVRIHQSERAAAVQRPFDEVLLSNPDPSFRVSPGLSSASPSSSRAGFPIDTVIVDRDRPRSFAACASHGSAPPSLGSPRLTGQPEIRPDSPARAVPPNHGDSLVHEPPRPLGQVQEEECSQFSSGAGGKIPSAPPSDASEVPAPDLSGGVATDWQKEDPGGGAHRAEQGDEEEDCRRQRSLQGKALVHNGGVREGCITEEEGTGWSKRENRTVSSDEATAGKATDAAVERGEQDTDGCPFGSPERAASTSDSCGGLGVSRRERGRGEGEDSRVRESADFSGQRRNGGARQYFVEHRGGGVGVGPEAGHRRMEEEEKAFPLRCGAEPTGENEMPRVSWSSERSPMAGQVPVHEEDHDRACDRAGGAPVPGDVGALHEPAPVVASASCADARGFHDHSSFPRFYSLEDEEDLVHISSFLAPQTEISPRRHSGPHRCSFGEPQISDAERSTGGRQGRVLSPCTGESADRNPFSRAFQFFRSACRTGVSSGGTEGHDREERVLLGQLNGSGRFLRDPEHAPAGVDVASLLPSSIIMDRVDLENIFPCTSVIDASSPAPFSDVSQCRPGTPGGARPNSATPTEGTWQHREGSVSASGRAVQLCPLGGAAAGFRISAGATRFPDLGAPAFPSSVLCQILRSSWVVKARKLLSHVDTLCFETATESSPHYFVLLLLLLLNVFSSSLLHLLLGHGMRARAWAAALTAVLVGVLVQLRLSVLLYRKSQARFPLPLPRRPRLSDFYSLSQQLRGQLGHVLHAAGQYAKRAVAAPFLWMQAGGDSPLSATGVSRPSGSALLFGGGSRSQEERSDSIEIAAVTGWSTRPRREEGKGLAFCPDSAGKPRKGSGETPNAALAAESVLRGDSKSYLSRHPCLQAGSDGTSADACATGSLALSCSTSSPFSAWISLLFLGCDGGLPPLLLTPLVGFFTGVFAGLVGVGGGVVFSPFLLFMGADPVSSVATASACVVFTSASTSLQFLLIGRLPIVFGVLFGLVAGTAAAVATCGIHKVRRAVGGQMSIIAGCVAAAVTVASLLTVWRCVEVWLQAGQED